MSTRRVGLSLTLPPVSDWGVVRAEIHEGISKLTRATVEIAGQDDLDVATLLEAEATLSLSLDGAEERRWTLRVERARFLGISRGSLRYAIDFCPALGLLRLETNTRKFRNLSARDIVSKVLGDAKVPFSWSLTRAPAVRKYCVQYRETNLDFVLRLLEFEGIYTTFSPEGVVLFADRSSASPPAPGASSYPLLDAAGALDRGELGIHAFRKAARVAPGTATVNDFNWKTPKTKLLAQASASQDQELDVYDYPTGYRKPEQGAVLAGLRLEALRVPAKTVLGKSNVGAFAPAHGFSFENASTLFAGEYVLVSVDHRVVDPRFEDETKDRAAKLTYENDFEAIPRSVSFRPSLATKHPHVTGCHTAMVRGPSGEEIHTDRYGRFRAQFHWDREAVGTDDDSRWVRNLQESATSMTLARVGWEMSMAYIDGDPDRPIGFARNINGVMAPEYAQPANKTRMTIKTPSSPATGGYNELRLEDMAGSQHFDWKAEKDFIGDVVNDRTEHVGNNETRSIQSTSNHSVEHDQKLSIGGNYKTQVDGSYPFTVTKDRKKKVTGNETIEVGKVLNVSAQGDEVEEVGGSRTTKAGDDGGAITRVVEETMKRTVKGSVITTGNGDNATLVGDAYVEKVTGTKMTIARNGNIAGKVSGPLDVEVTGSVMRMASKDMGFSAEHSKVHIKTAATLASKKQVTIQGDEIVIEATGSLTLQSANLSIAMTPGKTSIKGQLRLESKNTITVSGTPDNLTK